MMTLTLKGYKKILSQVQKTIRKTEQNIVQNVNRQKVEMCWELGKIIDKHLLKNDRADYGKKFFQELSKDTSIVDRTLYQMRSFYKAYPALPKETTTLNWSHYRNLASVKNDETRKYLEDLTATENLGAKELQKKISKSKPHSKKNSATGKLNFERGKLFTYALTKNGEVDLGFNVFFLPPSSLSRTLSSLNHPLPSSLDRRSEDLRSSASRDPRRSASRMTAGGKTAGGDSRVTIGSKNGEHTYLAELERVVDGDTVHVKLDLGFGIKHREILRLAKINAAEADTAAGKRATAALKEILKDAPFLIVKTNKTDIYGRYVADVFFGKKNETGSPYLGGSSRRVSATKGVQNLNPQKVADNGIYLNQLLLDRGLVELF